MSLQPTTLLSSDSPCSHCFFSAVLPLNFSGAKLFSSAGSRMQLLVAVRRWKQGPDWPWIIYPSLTFMGASLRQNSYYLCARCLALNVFTTSAHEELHRVTLWILCCSLSHAGKQSRFIQWQNAEWFSLILSYPLYPEGWHLFRVCKSTNTLKSIKDDLRELLKEVKTEIFPIITHTP